MKKVILISFFILSIAILRAQKLSVAIQKSLNDYIDLIEECNGVLNQSVPCIARYYKELGTLKMRSQELRSNSACLPAYSNQSYNSISQTALPLSVAHQDAVKTEFQEMWNVYLIIHEKFDEIEKSIQNQDLPENKMETFNRNLIELQTLIDAYKRYQDKLFSELRSGYQAHSHQNREEFIEVEKRMLAFIVHERELLNAWEYRFAEMAFDHFPKGRIEESYYATQKLYQQLLSIKNLPPIAEPFVKKFGEAMMTSAKLKQAMLIDLNKNPENLSIYSNKLYLELGSTLNNEILFHYNQFVQAASSKKSLFLRHPSFLYRFYIRSGTFDSSATLTASASKSDLAFRKVDQTVADPASKEYLGIKHPRGMVPALNACVDFINESIQNNRLLQQSLKNYNLHANYIKGFNLKKYPSGANLGYADSSFTVARQQFETARKACYGLPEPYRNQMKEQLWSLLDLLQELDGLHLELKDYVNSETYKKDKLVKSDQILSRFKTLFEVFDLKKEAFYTEIISIYNKYPHEVKNEEWKKSIEVLDRSIKEAFSVYKIMLEQYYGQQTEKPKVDQLRLYSDDLISNYDSLTTKLPKSGSLTAFNMQQIFLRIGNRGLDIVEKTNELSEPIRDDFQTFNSYVYAYNEMIADYNIMAGQSGEDLLKLVNQPYIFTLSTDEPEIAEQGAVLSPDSDSSLNFNTMNGYAPNNMVLLLDVSASMRGRHKLALLKKSFNRLIPILRKDDEVSIVIYSGQAKVILPPTSMDNKDEVRMLIDMLRSSGQTNGNDGLKMALEVAKENFIHGGNNRIILATDGELNIKAGLYKDVEKAADQGIYLSVFNFGRPTSEYEKLNRLAERGKGTYYNITLDNSDDSILKEAKALKINQ